MVKRKKSSETKTEKEDKTGIDLRFDGTLSLSKTVVLPFVLFFVIVVV